MAWLTGPIILSGPRQDETMPEQTQTEPTGRAQEVAQQTADDARAEFGRWAFETLEQHFPEQAPSRNRRRPVAVFVAGVAVGLLLRSLHGR
jgi:hypothetical protein